LRVRVVNHRIYLADTNHIRIVAEVKNCGKVAAETVFFKCKMTGQMDTVYFSETKIIRNMYPGESEYFELFTLIPLPDGCHVKHMGDTLNIERDDSLNRLVERLDCKFEVNAY
jgi:hypothetical protein